MAKGKCHVQLRFLFHFGLYSINAFENKKQWLFIKKKTGLLNYQMHNHKHDHIEITIQTM